MAALAESERVSENAWASVSVSDPFHVAKYSSSTGDATYAQSSTTDNHMRSVSGSFTWTWGKAPEQQQRRQKAEQPQSDTPP